MRKADVVESAMRYRAQAPFIDSILKEVGLGGVTPSQMGLAGMLESGRAQDSDVKALPPKGK